MDDDLEKLIQVIISCKHRGHFDIAKSMIEIFYIKYRDFFIDNSAKRMYCERIIQEAMNEAIVRMSNAC